MFVACLSGAYNWLLSVREEGKRGRGSTQTSQTPKRRAARAKEPKDVCGGGPRKWPTLEEAERDRRRAWRRLVNW